MAAGISSYCAGKLLEATCKATAFSVTTVYIQLHTATPGAAGTTAIATETRRMACTFAAASAGSIASNADVVWTSIAGSQTATFFTAWDASTVGNFLFSGSVTGNAYNAGDTFTITSGTLVASLTLAS